MTLVFKANVGAAIPLSLFAAILYIPAFYFTDSLLYRNRMRRRERARQQEASD